MAYTEEWLRAHQAKMANQSREIVPKTGPNAPAQAAAGCTTHEAPTRKPNKYRNTRVEYEGEVYDSKHEAKVYQQLRLRCLAGEFKGLAKQVAFFLPGGVKYVADFVTLDLDGTYTVYDAKSEATRKDKTYRLKKRQMAACLGIEIQEM